MYNEQDITAAMRSILINWLIEVQENVQLFHETLYRMARNFRGPIHIFMKFTTEDQFVKNTVNEKCLVRGRFHVGSR